MERKVMIDLGGKFKNKGKMKELMRDCGKWEKWEQNEDFKENKNEEEEEFVILITKGKGSHWRGNGKSENEKKIKGINEK